MKKIFTIILVAFTGVAIAQPAKIVADKIIAVVGDRIILHSEIQTSIADIVRGGQQVPENADCMILEQALVSKVLMLQAEKDSLIVTEDEVEAELDQRIRYYISAYGGQQALEDIAGKTIYQIKEDARESIRERKLAEAMQKKIVENVRITPTEVKIFFDRIPTDSLPFYESEFEVGQIVLYPKASRDLEKYVMDELANYKRQAESKVATFEQLAKTYSEDPGSKDQGGRFELNRNDKNVDPTFLAAAFRLKEGEISPVIKSQFGYHIIQMVQRSGDDAVVRHILKIPPVTATEISESTSKLDSVRAKLITGSIGFNEAALKYTEDKAAAYQGPMFLARDGSPYVTIDQLDKEIVALLGKLKIGEYSQPLEFKDERGKQGVRIVYLKSRSEPHRMNLKDDYNKIANLALEEKKIFTMEKWMATRIPSYYIMLDQSVSNCTQLKKWNASTAGSTK